MSRKPLSALSLPPSTLSALTRAGYNTVEELSSSSPEVVAKDLNISLTASQSIFASLQKANSSKIPTLGQSAATFVASVSSKRFSSSCAPLDRLLEGGLVRGHVLEISGPPGTHKERLAVDFVRQAVDANEAVLFVDDSANLVHHLTLHTAPELLIFLHNLPAFLDAHPTISLLVLNSIWFPFQSPSHITPSTRSSLLARLKQTLSQLCASRHLTVVVTNQMSTKLLNPDGSPANFDTGSRAVLVPQLGGTYLPSGRSHRVLIVPNSRTTGYGNLPCSKTAGALDQKILTRKLSLSFRVLRVLPASSGNVPTLEESYRLVGGSMQALDN
ncbi:hypothetical protein EW146_g6847 [Bondarzewia mesenterica]|uniref:RecA family profile 1 domain-containing protein n=1 Tax=Bondarzewia mesenterica TaxID=1095465 RepID=A0A4S4LMK2_9AGAM|nr:hypothetical protein EW146_g6847 [Bondarzewia mesenterica]